jgi:hypothetical protein
LVLSGMPHAADPQTWTFYPPNLLRAVLNVDPNPRSTAFGLTILMALHLIGFGAGTFALARRHGLSGPASATAAAGAALSALFVRRLAEFHFAFTLAWLPWCLLLVNRLLSAPETRERLRFAVLLGLCLACSVLGGFPQILPYIGTCIAVYGAAVLLQHGRPSPREIARASRRALVYGMIASFIAVGAASILLIPALEFLELSPRAGGSGAVAEGYEPVEWGLGYAWRSLSVYPGSEFEPETLRGAGVAILALAVAGGVVRFRRALPFVLTLYAMIDLMAGPPFPLSTVVSLLTPFQMVSSTRAFDVAILPLGVLAGYGLDALRDARKRTRVAAASIAAGTAVLGVVQLFATLRAGIWLDYPMWVVIAPALAVVAVLAAALWGRRRHALSIVVLALVLAELWAWGSTYVPMLTVRPGHDATMAARLKGRRGAMWPDNYRGSVEDYNQHLYRLDAAMNGYNPFHIGRVRKVLSGPERGLSYRRAVRETEIPQRNARGHLLLKRAFWLADTAVRGPLPAKDALFPPTKYVFLAGEESVGSFPTVPPEQVPARPYSLETATVLIDVPRAPRVGRNSQGDEVRRYEIGRVPTQRGHAVLEVAYESFHDAELYSYFGSPGSQRAVPGLVRRLARTDGQQAWVRVPMPDLSPVRIMLETVAPPGSTPPTIWSARIVSDLADEDDRIEIVSRSADRVTVRLRDLPAERMLVFLDADYPGWLAYVDGADVPILLADDAFKAVVVPAGNHTVEFRFSSATVRIGGWITAFTTIASLATLLILRLRATRKGDS